MASLIANLALGVLSVGAVTTAVTIPTVLLTSKENKTVHKPHKDWKDLNDFRKYCFGGFLKGEGGGELIVCKDETQKDSADNPIFYLIWGNSGKESPQLVKKIEVNEYRRDKWQVEIFTNKNNQEQKVLIVNKNGQRDLKALNSPAENSCKIIEPNSIASNNDYFLECSLSNNKYKVSIKKGEFNFLVINNF